MADSRPAARVVFTRMREKVISELSQGYTAKAIYDRHSADFAGISYPHFTRYVRLLRVDRLSSMADRVAPGMTGRQFARLLLEFSSIASRWGSHFLSAERIDKEIGETDTARVMSEVDSALKVMAAEEGLDPP